MQNKRRFYYDDYQYYKRAPGKWNYNWSGKGASMLGVRSHNSYVVSKYRNKMRKKGYWSASDFQYMGTGMHPYDYKTRYLVPEPMEFNTYSPTINIDTLSSSNNPSFFHHLVLSHQNFNGVDTSINLSELNVDFNIQIVESNTLLLKPNFFLVAAPNPYFKLNRDKNIALQNQPVLMVPKTEYEMWTEANNVLQEVMDVDIRTNPDLLPRPFDPNSGVPYREIETVRATKYELDRKVVNQLSSSGTGFHTIKFRFKGNKIHGDIVLNPGDAVFVVCWVSIQSLNDKTPFNLSSQTTCMFTKN